jgi:hypothetical protein
MTKAPLLAVFCAAIAGCSASSGDAAAERGATRNDSMRRTAAGAGAPAMPPAVDQPLMPMVLQPVMTPGAMTGRDADCAAAAKLVCVLDQNGTLSSFRPDTLQFTDIGKLACESGGSPYSMSVDRRGTAWVVYTSGQMYKVSTTDVHCEPVARQAGAAGFSTFGMSFVAVGGQAGNDQLFIAGMRSFDQSFDLMAALGVIDPTSAGTTRLGALDGVQPELTGTGDGKLWAFFPQSAPPLLNRLDTKTAATLESHPLNAITSGSPLAWAIAFWGGDFWVFLQLPAATSTVVYDVDGKTFTPRTAIADSGRSIVGAGVSTCAPLTLF